jgi:oxygen-independent coproporphyrinogen-3 oxidase
MNQLGIDSLIEEAERELSSLPITKIESSSLRKDPRMLELSLAYPGPLPYQNETSCMEIYSPENLSLITNQNLKLYIHLPFCAQRCKFCFYETSIGTGKKEIDDYLDSIIGEFDLILNKINKNPKTKIVYLGGGTPNYLSSQQMDYLLSRIISRIEPTTDFILNIENHPDFVKEEMMNIYAKYAVNRVSMGVQTFQDNILNIIGRTGQPQKIEESYRLLSECASIKEINLDLIYGLPKESLLDWIHTLDKVLELKPKELTLYSLKIHPRSHFYTTFKNEKLSNQNTETQLVKRLIAHRILIQKGYNLSRPHHYLLKSKSEIGYDRAPGIDLSNDGIGFQIGLGCSAYSHLGIYSYHNQINFNKYLELVHNNHLPFLRGKRLSIADRELIFILGNLCSNGHLSKEEYQKRVISQHQEFDAKLQELISLGVVEDKKEDYQLTMAGNLYFDEIGLFLWPEPMRQIYLQECGRTK